MKSPLVILLSIGLLIAAGVKAQTQVASNTASSTEVDAVYSEVEAFYLDLPQHPELSMHEEQTAAKLAANPSTR